MQNKYLYFFRLAVILSDFLALNGAFFLALSLTENYNVDTTLYDWKYPYSIINLMWIVSTNRFKLYTFNPLNNFTKTIKLTLQSTCLYLTMFLAYINFIGSGYLLNFIIAFVILTPLFFICSRLILNKAKPIIKRTLGPTKPISWLEIPSNRVLASYINNNNTHYHFERFANDKQQDNLLVDNLTQKLSYNNLFKDAEDKGLGEVYISLSPDNIEETTDLQREADKYGIRLKLIYNFNNHSLAPALTNYIGNFPVLSLRKEPLEDMNNIFIKRIYDIIISSLVIIFILSWLYPILALLIISESRGPVLFKQTRSGRSGKNFTCYKFRSMKVNELGDTIQASKQDDRKTKIGHFLRKTSLDELPQFWNVLLGDMSIVGPRPHMLKHTEIYRNLIDNYMVRHYLKPGITGWAQVNGFRGETRTLDLMEKRVEHDIWYIENWSARLDLEIIWKTCVLVFTGEENAY